MLRPAPLVPAVATKESLGSRIKKCFTPLLHTHRPLITGGQPGATELTSIFQDTAKFEADYAGKLSPLVMLLAVEPKCNAQVCRRPRS